MASSLIIWISCDEATKLRGKKTKRQQQPKNRVSSNGLLANSFRFHSQNECEGLRKWILMARYIECTIWFFQSYRRFVGKWSDSKDFWILSSIFRFNVYVNVECGSIDRCDICCAMLFEFWWSLTYSNRLKHWCWYADNWSDCNLQYVSMCVWSTVIQTLR